MNTVDITNSGDEKYPFRVEFSTNGVITEIQEVRSITSRIIQSINFHLQAVPVVIPRGKG